MTPPEPIWPEELQRDPCEPASLWGHLAYYLLCMALSLGITAFVVFCFWALGRVLT